MTSDASLTFHPNSTANCYTVRFVDVHDGTILKGKYYHYREKGKIDLKSTLNNTKTSMRGHNARIKLRNKLLKKLCAIYIQKLWRGHLVRAKVNLM